MHPFLSGILESLSLGSHWNNEQILREEIFSIERLEQHAQSLAAAQTVARQPGFRRSLRNGCGALGIAAMDIPSGAGHDAQDFTRAGIPAAMIFVRNAHGSHNPHEAMEMGDFALGVRLLTWMLASDDA